MVKVVFHRNVKIENSSKFSFNKILEHLEMKWIPQKVALVSKLIFVGVWEVSMQNITASAFLSSELQQFEFLEFWYNLSPQGYTKNEVSRLGMQN